MNENEMISREDILKELFNIGVGKAASTLSEIIDKRILLNIPDVKLLDLKDGDVELNQYLSQVAEGAIMVSSISFREQLEGKVSLIFPADKMRHFINLCLHEDQAESPYKTEFTDIDFDTIKEIGNIVLNSIMGEVGNFVNLQLDYTLPEVKVFHCINAETFMDNGQYTLVLLLYITFNIEDTEIEGAIVINLTLKSLDDILNKIYDGR